jgi:predicted nucleotidyltransferase
MAKDAHSDNSYVDFLVELEQGRDLFDLARMGRGDSRNLS